MTSTRMIDWLGQGLASARPTSLSISSGGLGIYFATDTDALSLWNGSAWVAYGGSIGMIDMDVGGTIVAASTLFSGGNVNFSGTGGDITISSTETFVQGSLTATGALTIGTNLSLSGSTNPTLSGAGSGTLGVNYAGTIYPTLAAGTGFTLAGSGSVLTGSASGGGGGSGLFGNLIASQPTSPPTTTSMGYTVWNNQRSATFTNGLNGVLFSDLITEGTELCNITKAAPATPYTVTVGIVMNPLLYANNQVALGFIDASGKHEHINFSNNGTTPLAPTTSVQRWSSNTAFDANLVIIPGVQSPVFLRIHNDGTTVSYEQSFDGEVFTTLQTVTISSSYLSGYATLALTLNSQSGPATASIFYYKETSP